MNAWDVGLIVLLAGAVALAVRKLVRNKRDGKTACGCDCGSCNCGCGRNREQGTENRGQE